MNGTAFHDKVFLTAGKAIFTIPVDGAPSGHYTYKVTKKESNRGPGDVFFVSLLSGPDNESSYQYLGMLNAERGEVFTTAKSRVGRESAPVLVVQDAVKRIYAGEEGLIMHAGHCGRCGRLLTHRESIVNGFGPECAGKI